MIFKKLIHPIPITLNNKNHLRASCLPNNSIYLEDKVWQTKMKKSQLQKK